MHNIDKIREVNKFFAVALVGKGIKTESAAGNSAKIRRQSDAI
jgi:D-alanine-D-alanine ligase-like ATP-grasp enzyme